MNRKRFFPIILLFFFLAGCASTGQVAESTPIATEIPPTPIASSAPEAVNQLGDMADVNREAIIKQANADLPGLADLTYLNGEAGSVLFPAGEENQTLFSTGLMIDSGSGSSLSLQTKILGYAIASREIQGKGEVPIFSLVPENL